MSAVQGAMWITRLAVALSVGGIVGCATREITERDIEYESWLTKSKALKPWQALELTPPFMALTEVAVTTDPDTGNATGARSYLSLREGTKDRAMIPLPGPRSGTSTRWTLCGRLDEGLILLKQCDGRQDCSLVVFDLRAEEVVSRLRVAYLGGINIPTPLGPGKREFWVTVPAEADARHPALASTSVHREFELTATPEDQVQYRCQPDGTQLVPTGLRVACRKAQLRIAHGFTFATSWAGDELMQIDASGNTVRSFECPREIVAIGALRPGFGRYAVIASGFGKHSGLLRAVSYELGLDMATGEWTVLQTDTYINPWVWK